MQYVYSFVAFIVMLIYPFARLRLLIQRKICELPMAILVGMTLLSAFSFGGMGVYLTCVSGSVMNIPFLLIAVFIVTICIEIVALQLIGYSKFDGRVTEFRIRESCTLVDSVDSTAAECGFFKVGFRYRDIIPSQFIIIIYQSLQTCVKNRETMTLTL